MSNTNDDPTSKFPPATNQDESSSGIGMGRSAPLVTVVGMPNVRGVVVPTSVPGMAASSLSSDDTTTTAAITKTTTVSASEHPLANPLANNPPLPPPLPRSSGPPPMALSHHQEPSGAREVTAATNSVLPLPTSANSNFPLVPPVGSAGGAPQQHHQQQLIQQQLPPQNSSMLMNQDDMADAFLRGDGLSVPQQHQPLLRPLPLPPTETDLERVRVLVERRAWGDVLSLTTTLLKGGPNQNLGNSQQYSVIYKLFKSGGDGKTLATLLHDVAVQEFVEILLLQGHAWIQMRRYKELAAEIAEWSYCRVYNSNRPSELNGDDIYDYSHTTRKRSETWIPWSVYIFAAASLQYMSPTSDENNNMNNNNHERCTKALWMIRRDVQCEIPNNPAAVLDLIHVDHMLCNSFLAQHEWRLALESLELMKESLRAGVIQMMKRSKKDEAPPLHDQAEAVNAWVDAAQCEIWSRQGRIFLQIGALEAAHTLFEQAQSLWQDVSHKPEDLGILRSVPQAQRLLDRVGPQLNANFGLLHFAYKKYTYALEFFRKALMHMDETDVSLTDTSTGHSHNIAGYLATDWVGGGFIVSVARHSLYSEISTNLAVAALYMCRLHEAVYVMENLIRRNPSEALTERSALNLCTLYELSGDNAMATRKKRTLQLIAKRFFLHDIGPESFRL